MLLKRILTVAVVSGILLMACAHSEAPDAAGVQEPLTASGTIQAEEVRLASELGGRILNVTVKEGDGVRASDVVVVFDSTPWELQLLPAKAALATAEAELSALKAKPRAEEVAAAQAALDLAEAERDGARKAWKDAQAMMENPQDLDDQISEARTQVALAEQGVELAKAELARVQLLRDQKSEGTTERRAADLQVTAAENALAAAQEDLGAAKALLNHLYWIRNEPLGYIAQVNAAEGQYRVAEAGVAVAQARLDDLLAGPTPEEIAVAEASVAQAQAQVDLLNLKIQRCTLTSPIDGVVVAQVLHIGELAGPAVTILVLADLSKVRLEVYVPENRIGEVQLAQEVYVTVDAFPERQFSGRVTKIYSEPEYTPRNVATKEERLNTFYRVEITLPNSDGLLKPGMPADCRF